MSGDELACGSPALTCSVGVELGEKLDELVLVLQEDVLDGLGFVRVGHKHLGAETETA